MREHTRRNTAAGLAAAALFVAGTGCTSGADQKDRQDSAVPCRQGTYAWSGIEREQKLTGLADPIRLTTKTDSVSVDLNPLRGVRYQPHMTSTAPGVRAADAIKALGRHLKTTVPLADPSEAAVPSELGEHFEAHTGHLQGAYYAWMYVDLVEADFTYTCRGGGPQPVKGHVLTWETTGSGFLTCGDPRDVGGFAPTGAAERTAARKLCPTDSPAAKSA
ncbi:hypothetical protein ACIPC1_08585 [Streptomyces sp. NPDC087263]|uniref:hypothetical protein n=1 Tax=Streptomyces sp. NPDC087263 TaxID=3365773 RepID=UPI00381D046B